jgi:hypothetical protein
VTREVVFIDSSILCNLVPVPGRDQDAASVREEMSGRLRARQQFILPITAVIETGNFIAQVADGHARRGAAMHDVAWNRSFLERFLRGADTGADYVRHAVSRLGAGDLCVLTEREHYRTRTGVAAQIWSLDSGLSAHS